MDEKQRETFTVRVPVKISQADDGTIIVHEYKYISFFSDRGNDVQMLPNEYAAFCDLMLDKTTRWTAKNAHTAASIDRHADLYFWWNGFIEGSLGQVPIGSDQFRESRAGLIHSTFLNLIRRESQLSPADFKSLSLAEVFAVISDIHCREHNEENRLRHQETGRKPDANRNVPDAEKLPFGLQRCDVPRWLRRPEFDKTIEIPEVYSAVMEALMAAAPNAVTDAKKSCLKASGYDTKNAPKKLREVIDAIGLTVDAWTLRELETRGYQK